jgi:integrase
MARHTHRLSVAKVERLKHSGALSNKGNLKSEYHCDGDGLYLQVSPTGSKSWIFRFTLRGQSREMGLGSFPTHSLAMAREDAAGQRQLVKKGIDPIGHRDEEGAKNAAGNAATLTFDECARRYIKDHRDGWSAKHAEQWTSSMETYASPIIGRIPVRLITMRDVRRVLDPIWKTKTETASRVRSRIENILDWAKAHGYREGENPAKWRGNLDKVFPKRSKVQRVVHHAAMKYAEMPGFVRELRSTSGAAHRALEFAILTAARSGEVRGARWDEFDLEDGLWTIPAERMKMGKGHRVPLSVRAIEIVQAQPHDGALVFSGVSQNALLNVLERMGRDDVTVHGFRSTFRVWGAEQTAYPRDLLEFALAHKVGDAVEAAYNRTDMLERRRQLMTDWASFCEGVEAPARIELPEDHPARIAYEKALREMGQARPAANVVRLKSHSAR